MHLENIVSKLLDENTANIEKAKSVTAGLSAAQMNWRPQPGKWSIAQNLDHQNRGARHLDTIASSIAAVRANGIIGNGPFRYGWLSCWMVKRMEPLRNASSGPPRYTRRRLTSMLPKQ